MKMESIDFKTFVKIAEIVDLHSEGLCESCEHGYEKCLEEGRAYCKYEEEVKSDGEKEPV